MRFFKCLMLAASLFFAGFSALADDTSVQHPYDVDNDPWSLLLYHGTLAETSLGDAVLFDYPSGEEHISSIELARELPKTNMIRRFFAPWISSTSFALNYSVVTDPKGPIQEIDPFFMFRWTHFPWDNYVVSTFGIGWGVSYDSRVSVWEERDSGNTKRLLNFLAFETTLAMPKLPEWQLVLRIHHRSGAFGLYGADNAGSNFIGAGIRYYF